MNKENTEKTNKTLESNKPKTKVVMKPKKEVKSAKKLVAIRIRGKINLNHAIITTLQNLNLHKQNWCVIIENTKSNMGMLNKVKDFITYGEIEDSIVDKLYKQKGELYIGRITDSKNKIKYKRYSEYNGKKYKKYFRLNPPKGGFEKKGIKIPFKKGGVLGYRADKIIDLINKMI